MSRRRRRYRRPPPIQEFLRGIAKMPWWGGVGLAVFSFMFLHELMATPSPVATRPDQAGEVMVHAALTPMATVLQFFILIIYLIGAAVSFARSRHRGQLFQHVASSQAADAVDQLTWQDFEKLVAEAFRRDGYSVAENGCGGPDGGVDLVLRRGNEKFFVQCKQWKAYTVGVDVVRELYGVMAAQGATGGFVVTSGTFSSDAVEFARGRNVQLIDGPKLHALLRRARNGPARAPASSPACPLCGSRMVKRTAKRGQHAGAEFWGCQRYPECKGIVEQP